MFCFVVHSGIKVANITEIYITPVNHSVSRKVYKSFEKQPKPTILSFSFHFNPPSVKSI